MGDTVTFIKNEIVDWMYMDAGTMKGNYSARAQIDTAADREAFKRQFGLDFRLLIAGATNMRICNAGLRRR
jgi:uncharacterized protein YegJ (DUF2314 family)